MISVLHDLDLPSEMNGTERKRKLNEQLILAEIVYSDAL